ncbi:MAG: preprotein translocase subunit SecG [Candidatus Wildermuthbacteria bacterium RIFCSPHIGHO2_12_FULL_45_9]|uniref:Protein-export membrane protein SecG n=1 Tax=Candidatus Wildermuthbacteria bacterium RIFCSPHIGHO2_02_FULL_45_25 TaxID=1802450 RepID=A0A1G2R4H1_9BACT|nr:MAG: preprotein translocase subunit SecG [Candidatus Wildermuthbacteria bacterium RIFCSPHIGHO2_01_FULL_45_20]OHA67458.1 MAG: preprotein translocase subunit SecG [Candidatus Wildermuthbacteria bacterium RIFCSPHIGHO2_02_FULL_45_25]OHA72350.1 MAG: preprotein translocase subunit SecG [Candidatus Wildermuthbacteria bacterium RIFCSPHIGHO2_12_FULL_45_9]
MNQILPFAQVIIAVFLMVVVLLQQRGTALGSSFGSEGGFYGARRGMQKNLYWATIVLGAMFVALSIVRLVA